MQLHQIKAGIQTESELTHGNRLSEVVFELGTIAPRVLTQVIRKPYLRRVVLDLKEMCVPVTFLSAQVLPVFADDLTLEDPSARIVAIKLLGEYYRKSLVLAACAVP